MKKVFAVGMVAASLACANVAQAQVVIDSFDTNQDVTVSGMPSGPLDSFSSVLAPEALGGERDVYVKRTSPNTGSVNNKVNTEVAGHLEYLSGGSSTGYAEITWDGVDGLVGVNHTGLGGSDLTGSGMYSDLVFRAKADL